MTFQTVKKLVAYVGPSEAFLHIKRKEDQINNVNEK